MELVIHSPFPTQTQWQESKETHCFTNVPKVFLSTNDVHRTLKAKKIELLQPDELPFDIRWKTVSLNLFIQGLQAGFFAFLMVASNNLLVEHPSDTTKQYAFRYYVYDDLKYFEKLGLSKDAVWTDHTRDIFSLNYAEGAKAFFPLAFLPPLIPLVFWKVRNMAFKYLIDKKNETFINHNYVVGTLDFRLLATSKKNEPCPPNFISQFFEILSDEQFKVLSFAQIRNIKIDLPEKFLDLLNEQKFSTQQNLYWKKLAKIMDAEPDNLFRAIMNGHNAQIFEEEPGILEAFIQDVDPSKLTDTIKEALATKLRLIHQPLSKLGIEDVIEIIDKVHKEKCPLEKAYTKHLLPPVDKMEMRPFSFLDKEKKKVMIMAPVELLCHYSDAFKVMLKGSFKETNEIELPDVDPKSFEDLISYLKTDSLDLEQIDINALLHLATTYFFDELHEYIESILMKTYLLWDRIDHVEDSNFDELLELSEKYNLTKFKMAIDLKISRDLPGFYSDAFLDWLITVKDFSLPIFFKKLIKAIKNDIETLVSDERFTERFINAVEVHEVVLEEFGDILPSIFENNPKLLEKLWDDAQENNCTVILEAIVSFCQEADNAHLYLANWDCPPSLGNYKPAFETIQIEDI